jgi:release factor glutamine methyltransferase
VGAAVADLGTGSGCIVVALAVRRPDLALFALDRSAAALELARENAERHGAAERIRFARADFAAPPATWRAAMHVVISNPPYVTASAWERLEPEVRDYEPILALSPGDDPLKWHRTFVRDGAAYVMPGGYLAMEVGRGQADAVAAMIRAMPEWEPPKVHTDLARIERVVLARRRLEA